MDGSRRGVFPVGLDDPRADDVSRPFWEAALSGRLVAQRCTGCATVLLPPQPICPACRSWELGWQELPGTGTVYSFTVVRHPLSADLADVVPYVAVVVELDGTPGAGARMVANLVDADPDRVAIGDRVRVRFDPVSATYAVPRFVPVEAADPSHRR